MAQTKKAAAEKTEEKAEKKPAKKTAAKTDAKTKKTTEKKTTEKKTAEKKTAEKKTAEKKTAEKKPAEKKTAEKKSETKKTAEKKTAAKKTEDKEQADFIEYKGRPLVRSGKTIYYGDLNEPYVVCLMIKSEIEQNGEKIADDVQVQLISTDETLSPMDRVIKKSEKKGLWVALDLGIAWLERQLKKG